MLDELLKSVPPESGKAYIGLLQHVPVHVRSLCTIGSGGPALGYVHKKRPGNRAFAIVGDAGALPVARKMLDGAATVPEAGEDVPLAELDALLLCNLETGCDDAFEAVGQLTPALSATCYVFALFGDPRRVGTGTASVDAFRQEIERRFGAAGFRPYQSWPLYAGASGDGAPALAYLMMAVPEGYDPLNHARALAGQSQHAFAYEVVEAAPSGETEPPERRLQVHQCRLEILGDWLEADPGAMDRSRKLMAAQESFYYTSFMLPREPAAFRAMARCWAAIGDVDLARRQLRTIQAVAPEAATAQLYERLPEPVLKSNSVEDIPAWESTPPPRILLLMNPRPHYGIDVLYDGLCACLGDDNVVDYPHKSWLHGGDTDELAHYPCRFNRAGEPISFQHVLARAEAGDFDAILYADVEGILPQEEMRAIVHRAGSCPVAIVDALDECIDFRQRVTDHLGFDRFAAYFKREKHRAIDYGTHCYPLPFAYDGRKAIETPDGPRNRDFFWAGHRMFGVRRLYLETLEQRQGWDLNVGYPPEEYIQCMRDSQVGLNCFGMGFDTVRYWELPAQGCLLLSERLPIAIPHNFEDGRQAAFFDDLPDLLEKVDYYAAHPDVAREIAAAGHQHFLQHHTNEARARQLLGWLFGGGNP